MMNRARGLTSLAHAKGVWGYFLTCRDPCISSSCLPPPPCLPEEPQRTKTGAGSGGARSPCPWIWCGPTGDSISLTREYVHHIKAWPWGLQFLPWPQSQATHIQVEGGGPRTEESHICHQLATRSQHFSVFSSAQWASDTHLTGPNDLIQCEHTQPGLASPCLKCQ